MSQITLKLSSLKHPTLLISRFLWGQESGHSFAASRAPGSLTSCNRGVGQAGVSAEDSAPGKDPFPTSHGHWQDSVL